MAVIGALAAVVYLLVPRPQSVEQPAVDVRAAVITAAEGMGTPGNPASLVVPSVPGDWRANAAAWSAVGPEQSPTLHVGYLTSTEQYAAVEITQRGGPSWIDTVTREGTPTGTATVAGRTWQTYRSADGQRTSLLLVRPAAEVRAYTADQGNKVTTVVTGTAERAELATLAAAVVR